MMRFHSGRLTITSPVTRKQTELGDEAAFVQCTDGKSQYAIAYFGPGRVPADAGIGTAFVATGSVVGEKGTKYGAYVHLRGETFDPIIERSGSDD